MRISFNSGTIDLNPTKILAVAKNYREHAREMNGPVPDEPRFFLKPPSALIGHNDSIILPKVSQRVDHEVELAVIMGQRCAKVKPSGALDHVMGYSIIIDVTARDLQKAAKEAGMPWAIAKGFDTFAPLGPKIIPARDINPDRLDLSLKINGVLKQNSNTREMVHKTAELISYISQIMTLDPMDIIATGTPEGVGPLKPGDLIEAFIEGVGVLSVNVRV
ncbi:MAG: fumarylacetoacetate hydrolase family protein [Deltaproteobacteria bacterium]|nr:fumarylacetoacetate hydrolase family protein [Deltaproteobacteria bacterium]